MEMKQKKRKPNTKLAHCILKKLDTNMARKYINNCSHNQKTTNHHPTAPSFQYKIETKSFRSNEIYQHVCRYFICIEQYTAKRTHK